MSLPHPKRQRGADALLDPARFLGRWISNPLKTGAVAPSGRGLARLMASYLDPAGAGSVIELGPGTGPVTQALIERGFAPHRLILIEYSEDFATLLRRRFPGVTVLRGDAYAVRDTVGRMLTGPALGVVSSLPLLTRPVEARRALLADALALCAPGAPFVQFTYAGKPPIPVAAEDYDVARSRTVLLNVPPARVFVYRRR
jgi:phosphatidylethanolamine/phosphatidyl-N-methylethanolamine N-methyltransferase